MINCILIDDEPKALKILQKKIENSFPELNILKTFTNPEKAIEGINSLKPDLIFLDIAMPKLSGFDVLSKFEHPDFEIIFVTAYDNYAIEAIKHAAIGYIVKPIDMEDLRKAVEKAKENIQLKVAYKNNKALLDLLTQKNQKNISIPTQDGFIFVKTDNIIRLEGLDGYTKIVCVDDKEYISSYNLGKFSEMLKSNCFFQSHRSHFINMKYVTGYINEGYVELNHSITVPLSKTKKKEFMEIINKI